MRKPELAGRLARQEKVTRGEAADELDRVVNEIIAKLRKGEKAPLPGLGQFSLGPHGSFRFEQEKPGPRGRK
jgi:nucleoid DNA-binding protein